MGGLFGGGGGGSVDVSAGVNAIQQGTEKGISSIQQYYKEAIPFLQENFNQAQANLAPYALSGSNALDELYDTLGVSRAEVGSYKLNSALKNEDALKKLKNATGTGGSKVSMSDFHAQGPNSKTGNSSEGWMETLGDGSSGWIFNPENGRFLQGDNSWLGNYNQGMNEQQAMDAAGVNVVRDEATGKYKVVPRDGTPPRALTAEEQEQWDLIQKYKNGQLAMTDPDQQMQSVLEKLQNSPGYQFNLTEGLQALDRSNSARGTMNSGAAIRGATKFSQGLAENTYNNRVQQLANAAGAGQQAATGQATYNAGLGGSLANAALGTGSNTASLYGSQAQGLAQLYAGQAAAQGQANAANSSGMFGLAGSVLGGIFSDSRLKDNVIRIGTLPNGLPVYEFNYKWDSADTRQVGLMAQDVLKVHPQAVFMDESGYYKVDYSEAVK